MALIGNLPSIDFTDKDAADVEAAVITMYESIAGVTLAQGDPVRLFLLSLASIIIQQRILIDFSAKQNLLAYSQDEYLDHIGILVGVIRLLATAAKTILRFMLSVAQPQVIIIPAGFRASTANGVIFATTVAVEIPAGSLSVDVAAACTSAGAAGNGYLPGQVNKFVDTLPYLQSVANTTTTAGGADTESNDSLRARIQQAPESFSVAGPDGAYEFWAKSASAEIADVYVWSPAAVEVEIRVLLTNGGLPGAEMLATVLAACNGDAIRPLTDKVTVLAPDTVSYDTALTYYISRSDAASSLAIQSAVTQAVADYQLWQKSKIGRDINPSELIYRVKAAGASRVVVTAPTFTTVQPTQVAIPGSTTVTFGGLEDG